MWILKNNNVSIPGSYFYAQTEQINHQFSAVPTIESLVKDVSAFRIANKLRNSSLAETFKDVVEYQCKRLGNHPNWCFECDDFYRYHKNHRFISKGCSTCGTPVNPN